MDEQISDAIKKLSPLKLRARRVAIYKKNVRPYSIFFRVKGVPLKPAQANSRRKNFDTFVKMYFYKGGVGNNNQWSNNMGLAKGLNKNSMGYKAFELYSKTNYGSASILEMISNHRKYKNFSVREATGKGALGDYFVMFLPKVFPKKPPYFNVGGQKIFGLAIIHHEFAHTMLARSWDSGKVSLKDEREAVLKAENPIRMINRRYEPRYVYFARGHTINIITKEKKVGRWSVSKYDPRKMLPLHHKDSL